MKMQFDDPANFSFLDLLARAVADWPEVVGVEKLISNPDRPEMYVVAGLGKLGDEMAGKDIGRADEILMTNLHEAICSTIRSAAIFSTEVKPSKLRADAVQEEFRKRIQLTIETPDLGWSDRDLALAKIFLLKTRRPQI